VQNPLRGFIAKKLSLAESRFRAWHAFTAAPTVAVTQHCGETMELLDLQPPDYGVHSKGIYIIDDDGVRIFAGPFDSETAAITWIIQRQEGLSRRRSAQEFAAH
jgi:hypothetical protein